MKIFGKIDTDVVEKLADIISSRHLCEITLSDGSDSITIKGAPMPPPPAGGQSIQPAALSADPAPAPSAAPREKMVSGNVVRSPIVGTFYSSPSPGKPAFVKVGDKVTKGDVVMIIESMKLMNEIKSEYTGTVKQILVRSGDTVEYDQPIMIIE